MMKTKFNVEMYDFDVTLVQLKDKDDIKPLRSIAKKLNINLDGIEQNITDSAFNGGITFTNAFQHEFLVIFYPYTDKMMRDAIYDHEKRHIEDDILDICQVNDKEAAAYLAEYLSKKFYKFKQSIKNYGTHK